MEHLQAAELVEDHDRTTIDARTDPGKANEVVRQVLSPSTAEALIELPPDCSVNLPGGYIHAADGKCYSEADVRELTGVDEEALAKPEVVKSLARFTQLLLQRGVTRLGPFENPNNNMLGSLLIGDREMLLIAIRRATYGNDLEMSVNCPACDERLDLQYDLSKDIPTKEMEDRFSRSFPYTTKDGQELVAHLAIGTDQEAVLGANNRTIPELNTLLLSRCVKDKAGVPVGVEGVRQMGIHDRRELLKLISEGQPGPKYQTMDIDCPVCAKQFPLALTLYDLFR